MSGRLPAVVYRRPILGISASSTSGPPASAKIRAFQQTILASSEPVGVYRLFLSHRPDKRLNIDQVTGHHAFFDQARADVAIEA